MTYKTHIPTASTASVKVALAPLTSGGYAAGDVFSVGAWDGNHSLSVAGGRITLPVGEYMLEAYPWVGTANQIAYRWFLDTGGGFSVHGVEGQIQTATDTADGFMNAAYCRVTVPQGSSYNIELRVTQAGSVTDAGGYIVAWKADLT